MEFNRRAVPSIRPSRDFHAADAVPGAEEQARALAVVHVDLILVHPFREGMALQVGLPPLDFSPLSGRGKREYIAGIHAAMGHDYTPLAAIFARVIERSRRRAASNGQ